MCLLLDITLITIRVALWPNDVDTFREIEKMPELRRRLEEASSMELQQGWKGREEKKGKEKERKGENGRISNSSEVPIAPETGGKEDQAGDVEDVEEIMRGAEGSQKVVNQSQVQAQGQGQGQARLSTAEPRSSLHSPSMERPRFSFGDYGTGAGGSGGGIDHDVLLARRFGSIKR